MAPTRSRGRGRPRAPRTVTYDPELVVNWTLQRLREECESLGLNPPRNARRSILLRMLRNALPARPESAAHATERSGLHERQQANDEISHNATHETGTTQNPQRADVTQNGRNVEDVEGVLSNVLDSLAAIQTQMQSFERRINNLSTAPTLQASAMIGNDFAGASERNTVQYDAHPRSLGQLSDRPELSVGITQPQEFTLTSAYTQFGLHGPSAAAGSPEQLAGPRPSAIRSRFGFSSQSIPEAITISPALRNSIIQGRDVNLAALLIPNFRGSGDNTERAYPTDNARDVRAPNKPLTIAQFIEAFAKYKTVMCSAFPHRRQELDLYEVAIVNMASRHPGTTFYDYHCQFAQRAAALLRFNNICIDWSVRDEILYNNIFSGRPVNACTHCGTTSHASAFCAYQSDMPRRDPAPHRQAADRSRSNDLHGRPRLFHQQKEICNNFNSDSNCRVQTCTRAHVCTSCKGDHPKSACPLDKAGAPPRKR